MFWGERGTMIEFLMVVQLHMTCCYSIAKIMFIIFTRRSISSLAQCSTSIIKVLRAPTIIASSRAKNLYPVHIDPRENITRSPSEFFNLNSRCCLLQVLFHVLFYKTQQFTQLSPINRAVLGTCSFHMLTF